MHQVRCGLYLELLKHVESYVLCFWRLRDIEKVTRVHFTGYETLNKVKLMYLEVKLKED